VFGKFKRKDFIQKLLFLEGKANKFASRSLKTDLHQINLLMLLCTLRKVYYQIKNFALKICKKKILRN